MNNLMNAQEIVDEVSKELELKQSKTFQDYLSESKELREVAKSHSLGEQTIKLEAN